MRPFNTSGVNRRLNTMLNEGAYASLTPIQLGLLRALISLADWETGAIPASREMLVELTHLAPTTISTERRELVRLGLLEERWRSRHMVQYGLTRALRAITNR